MLSKYLLIRTKSNRFFSHPQHLFFRVFVTGHSEYDPGTLEKEYLRDKGQGLPISVPENYYPGDDETKEPLVRWRGHGNLLFSNWLNYFVYQTTPYDIMSIGQEDEA